MTTQAVGNLVSDPKLINLKDDYKIVETRIAVTKSKDKSIYFDVKFKNNKAGEILLQYAKKGSGVFVWGEIDEETWGEGDNKRSKFILSADGFRFTGSGKSDSKGDGKAEIKPAAKTTSKSPPKVEDDSNDEPPF